MNQPIRLFVSVALLLAAFLILHLRPSGEVVQGRSSFRTFPEMVGSWKGQDESSLDPDVLRILKMSDYLVRRYVDPDGRSTWLYIGYWESQRKGSDIHSPKNCLPGGGWEPLEASEVTVPLGGSRSPISVNVYLIQKDKQMQVVVYWFQSQGKVVAGELSAKIQLVRGAILKNRTDGALVRVSSPVYGTVQETKDTLVQYVQALYPLLGSYLPE